MNGFDAFDPERIIKGMAEPTEAKEEMKTARKEAEAAVGPMTEVYAMLMLAGFNKEQIKLLVTAILKLAYSTEVEEWLKADGLIE